MKLWINSVEIGIIFLLIILSQVSGFFDANTFIDAYYGKLNLIAYTGIMITILSLTILFSTHERSYSIEDEEKWNIFYIKINLFVIFSIITSIISRFLYSFYQITSALAFVIILYLFIQIICQLTNEMIRRSNNAGKSS